VQIGAGGPEFIFDVEPRTRELLPTALLPIFPDGAVTEPRATAEEPVLVEALAEEKPAVPSRQPDRSRRRNRSLWIAVLAFLITTAVIFLLNGYATAGQYLRAFAETAAAWTRAGIQHTNAAASAVVTPVREYAGAIPHLLRRRTPPPTPADRAGSVTAIETTWQLIDSETGRQLQQVYIRNENTSRDGDREALVTGAGRDLPVFVLIDGKHLQPMLTFARTGNHRPIGRKSGGWGFVISPDGLILTNRRVAEPWQGPYEWPKEDEAGIVAALDTSLQVVQTGIIARRQFPKWVPTDAGFVIESSFVPGSGGLSNRRIRATGKVNGMQVVLPNQSVPVSARLMRSSDEADAAIISMAGAVSAPAVPMDTEADCKPGDLVHAVTRSERGAAINTGKVAAWAPEPDKPSAEHTCGIDVGIQSSGMMGAPVMDKQGRAIAVQTASDPLYPETVFAVPIRYARELISEQAVNKR
jgi:hypothetical protein